MLQFELHVIVITFAHLARIFLLFLLFFGLFLFRIVPVLSFQMPSVLVRILHTVLANFLEDFLQIADGLVGNVNKILNIVVLMLLEGIEKHVHDGRFVRAGLFAVGFLLSVVLNLEKGSLLAEF